MNNVGQNMQCTSDEVISKILIRVACKMAYNIGINK
jgi:hypothetical protein